MSNISPISGLTNGDQSVYPATNGVAPLAQEYPDTGLVDNNAYYNQGEYSQGGYDYTQYSDTDRLVITCYSLLIIIIISELLSLLRVLSLYPWLSLLSWQLS